jgi:hypothetical protein
MKRIVILGLILTGPVAGCFTPPKEARPTTFSHSSPAPQPLPPGPITADLVEAGNAHRVAEAIWDEMDSDQQKALQPPAKQPPAKQDAKKR